MKRLLIIFPLILITLLSQSQILIKRDSTYIEEDKTEKKQKKPGPNSDVQTLFQQQKSFGGYLGFSVGYSEIDAHDAISTGIRLMFVVNHYLGIGFGGKGIFSSTLTSEYSYENTDFLKYSFFNVGYGGLYLEPVIYSMKPVHVSIPVLLGGGAMETSRWNNDPNHNEPYNYISSAFFLIEPGLDVELNIAKWFRMAFGASYRFTTNIDGVNEIKTDIMNGLNYGITFKMGWY